jgi:DNA-binding NtrC family response regulator
MTPLKVLLVDDEEEFTSALAERLELRGVEASSASEGAGAIERVKADPPHVVVLDMMMPGLSGMDVLDFLKTHYPRVGVILLTGHGSLKAGMEGMKRGAFDYLVKPVNIDELVEKIRGAAAAASTDEPVNR